MRNAFAAEITALAAEDQRVVLLSGDIGNRLFDDFKVRAPGRFFNCGVAEANMIGVAAGMAMCGLRPSPTRSRRSSPRAASSRSAWTSATTTSRSSSSAPGAGCRTPPWGRPTIPARTSPSCGPCRT